MNPVPGSLFPVSAEWAHDKTTAAIEIYRQKNEGRLLIRAKELVDESRKPRSLFFFARKPKVLTIDQALQQLSYDEDEEWFPSNTYYDSHIEKCSKILLAISASYTDNSAHPKQMVYLTAADIELICVEKA
jgi:hypothetical protein